VSQDADASLASKFRRAGLSIIKDVAIRISVELALILIASGWFLYRQIEDNAVDVRALKETAKAHEAKLAEYAAEQNSQQKTLTVINTKVDDIWRFFLPDDRRHERRGDSVNDDPGGVARK